jgi:hypothetical protein
MWIFLWIAEGREREMADDRLAGLLAEAAEGDTEAFSQFYDAASERVLTLAAMRAWTSGLRGVALRQTAELAARRRFLVAWRQAAQHRRSGLSSMAWLLTLELADEHPAGSHPTEEAICA